jgi:hypothetical protein
MPKWPSLFGLLILGACGDRTGLFVEDEPAPACAPVCALAFSSRPDWPSFAGTGYSSGPTSFEIGPSLN